MLLYSRYLQSTIARRTLWLCVCGGGGGGVEDKSEIFWKVWVRFRRGEPLKAYGPLFGFFGFLFVSF